MVTKLTGQYETKARMFGYVSLYFQVRYPRYFADSPHASQVVLLEQRPCLLIEDTGQQSLLFGLLMRLTIIHPSRILII